LGKTGGYSAWRSASGWKPRCGLVGDREDHEKRLPTPFPPPAVLQMRANLMSDLRLYIEKQKLTQAAAAKRLGIAQSRVSDFVRGKWDKFSLEMLITLEARLGRTIRVEFAA